MPPTISDQKHKNKHKNNKKKNRKATAAATQASTDATPTKSNPITSIPITTNDEAGTLKSLTAAHQSKQRRQARTPQKRSHRDIKSGPRKRTKTTPLHRKTEHIGAGNRLRRRI